MVVVGLVVAPRVASYRENKGGIGIGDAQVRVVERHAVPNWIGWTAAGVGLIMVVAGLRGWHEPPAIGDERTHTP